MKGAQQGNDQGDALSRYLRGATKGLGRRQQEVRRELIGHIEARVQDFKLAGFGDAEALRQTLRELGEPEYVHLGMQRVDLLGLSQF